jgi:type I restriction enzyme, S subunit
MRSVGRIGELFKGNGGSKDDASASGVPCIRYGDLYTKYEFFVGTPKSFVPTEAATRYTPLEYGDLLFAASGETIEDIGRSAVNLLSAAVCGGDVVVCRPRMEIDPRFLGYAADSPMAKLQKSRMGRGFTVVHIYGSELKNLALPIPPLDEQRAIVRYLDHMDRRIRRYIAAKKKLIALLSEQKQAIIHRAVTRGLDPNVPLKPSGVEWLGEIPAHWEVEAFSRCATERADYRGATPTKTETGVFLVTAKNVKKGWIDYEASKEYVAESEYPVIMRRGIPKIDDLLLTTEAPLGNAALVDREDVALAQRVIRFRFGRRQVHPRFVLNVVLSSYFQDQLLRRGTGSTAVGIKASKLPQLRIALPPIPEQHQLLDSVDEATQPLAIVGDAASRAIELLREFRTRLIADVVTGKLDVREAAARLPEETDEPADIAEPIDDTTGEDAEAPEEEEAGVSV